MRTFPPGEGAAGLVKKLGQTALSYVPIVGPVAALIVGEVLEPTVQRNNREFFTDLGNRIGVLEEKGLLTIGDLKENPQFSEAVLRAARIAAATSSRAKRELLRNAVLNIGLRRAPGADIQHLYLRLVDELTPTHIHLLRLIQIHPQQMFPKDPQRADRPLLDFFSDWAPELALDPRSPETERFLRTLIDESLITDRPNTRGGESLLAEQPRSSRPITTLGERFLRFVSLPPEAE